jgi:hypothetical protein
MDVGNNRRSLQRQSDRQSELTYLLPSTVLTTVPPVVGWLSLGSVLC